MELEKEIFKGKKIADLVDQLDGYSVKHSKVRKEIYQEQKFEISKSQVDLTKKRSE